MRKKHLFIFILVFLFTLTFLFLNTFDNTKKAFNKPYPIIKVHFIDVGQGDSILIQVNNKNTLIDAGDPEHCESLVSYLKKLNIKTVDYLIATHPHDDHIGGMYDILTNFNVKSFYAPKVSATTDSFKYMVYALKKKNLKITPLFNGISLSMGKDVKTEFLAPNSYHYSKVNDYSAVLKLTYKNVSFLFCGDAENLSELEMLHNNKSKLKSNVLKVGHHGSKTSTCDSFLKAVAPNISVISCGKRNKFNHPDMETIKKLKNANCVIFRTDLDGTIVLLSDGYKIIKK